MPRCWFTDEYCQIFLDESQQLDVFLIRNSAHVVGLQWEKLWSPEHHSAEDDWIDDSETGLGEFEDMFGPVKGAKTEGCSFTREMNVMWVIALMWTIMKNLKRFFGFLSYFWLTDRLNLYCLTEVSTNNNLLKAEHGDKSDVLNWML